MAIDNYLRVDGDFPQGTRFIFGTSAESIAMAQKNGVLNVGSDFYGPLSTPGADSRKLLPKIREYDPSVSNRRTLLVALTASDARIRSIEDLMAYMLKVNPHYFSPKLLTQLDKKSVIYTRVLDVLREEADLMVTGQLVDGFLSEQDQRNGCIVGLTDRDIKLEHVTGVLFLSDKDKEAHSAIMGVN